MKIEENWEKLGQINRQGSALNSLDMMKHLHNLTLEC